MPTIVAICPYCRAGGVRAPDTALGASATCPKCKSSFTVLPSDDVPPDWDKPAPKQKKPAAPVPPPVEETRATAAMPDVTEPSPVLPAEPAPAASRAASAATPAEAASAATGYRTVFALGALCLVGPAVVATLFPFGRFVGLALAAVGLVAGLLSLGAEGRARLAGALAALLHASALVVLLFLPSWLDLDPWRGPAAVDGPKGPVAVENATGAPTAVSPDDWLDAGKHSWQNGAARVTVRADVGPVQLSGPKEATRTTKERYLRLTLRVRNTGYEKELPLSGWAAGQGVDGVRVTDANGKPLSPATFDAGWAPDRGKPTAHAQPGHASDVVLIFAAPPAKTEFVRVQLSGVALGLPDEIKFRTAPGIGGGGGALPPRPPGP